MRIYIYSYLSSKGQNTIYIYIYKSYIKLDFTFIVKLHFTQHPYLVTKQTLFGWLWLFATCWIDIKCPNQSKKIEVY